MTTGAFEFSVGTGLKPNFFFPLLKRRSSTASVNRVPGYAQDARVRGIPRLEQRETWGTRRLGGFQGFLGDVGHPPESNGGKITRFGVGRYNLFEWRTQKQVSALGWKPVRCGRYRTDGGPSAAEAELLTVPYRSAEALHPIEPKAGSPGTPVRRHPKAVRVRGIPLLEKREKWGTPRLGELRGNSGDVGHPPLHTPESGKARSGAESGGLGVEQFSSLHFRY